jgi:outer membrane receptor protein involved in Fe transport
VQSRCFSACAALAIVLAALFGMPGRVLAQTAGSITGTVTDSAGKPLGKARVAVSGPTTLSAESKPDGTFAVPVPPGIYSVTVSAPGFQSARNDNVVVAPGQTVAVTIGLSNSSLTTIGRTSRSTTSVNTTAAAAQTVSAQTLVSQGQNQVVNVLDQIPGVEVNHVGGGSNEPGANASISIRGAQPYESQVLLDGHPVDTAGNGPYGFNTTFINSLLLSSVEVSKGAGNLPNTIEDAIGGTVNFRTPSISPTFSAQALVGYDSFDSNYYGLRLSDTFGKIGLLVGVARNSTPGYLKPQNLYGGDNNYEPVGLPVTPDPTVVYGPGTAYSGVINFSYPATSDFESDSQLVKLAYNFSPQTSLLFESYSTQTSLDETGNNQGNLYATIVPCIFANGTISTTKCPAVTPINYYTNYTANPYLGLIGTVQAINYYAAYPNTTEFDNEPVYSGEFRTVIGPGSLLARYYAGSISRTVTQAPAPYALSPCFEPSCPYDQTPNTSPAVAPGLPSYYDIGYPGEPYEEPTVDVLHGVDAQYTLPLGPSNVTLGFDRHVDQASFGEDYNYTTGVPAGFSLYTFQSIAYSLRGDFQINPKLLFESGAYLSNTSYVGTRFDPREALTYKVNPNVALRGSWGSAFAAPYYDLIITKPKTTKSTITLPSSSFRPETSSGYDFGTDVKLNRDTLISGDLYYTNIFNRYASVTEQTPYPFDGTTYPFVTQNGNQANVRNEGLELNFLHAPRVGLGFHSAVDLLRDYAFNQSTSGVSSRNIFEGGTPGNGVQLPGYPFMKIRNDLTYTLKDRAEFRISSTTYGANNSFGQPGFTEFDAAIRTPLKDGLSLNLGSTNLFNKDNYQVGGIFNGGYTYQNVDGYAGQTDYYFVQPRTVYLQLQKQIGR